MILKELTTRARDKNNFLNLQGFIDFCSTYLEYVATHLQATIVAQNEHHYRFYQYDQTGDFQITRPINSRLMYDAQGFQEIVENFLYILHNIRDVDKNDQKIRSVLNNSAYTIQQCIGATLDALPAGQSNTARKLNGDLFERFIRFLVKEVGIECTSGVIQIPVVVDGQEQFNMYYQHDLIIRKEKEIKVIGSIKTSSKDRIDKIFTDKFLYNRLTDHHTPHIAIFLNDVQRKNTKKENQYSINSTFLPGHFKGYTVKLNPLDGVYYCDIRPNMTTDTLLRSHIKTFDNLLIEDIWNFID